MLNIIQFFLRLFKKTNPGALLDNPSFLSALPRHELFAAGAGTKPDWKAFCPPFRNQGSSTWCTAFAGCAIGYIFEKKENGQAPLFSPMELFYRSGGSVDGNYLIATAKEMTNAFVLDSVVTTPIPNLWGPDQWSRYKAIAQATQDAIAFGKKFKLKSLAVVGTTKTNLQAALIDSPLMILIGVGKGYWNNPAPTVGSYSAYHCVVLVDIDEQGNYVIFDSLSYKAGFDGFHTLSPDYDILAAFSFIDIPDNWQDIQNQKLQEYVPGPLQNYGKKRSLEVEISVVKQLLAAVKQNPSVRALIGRDWIICVNAIAYGGYDVQDILNQYTNIRRTGKSLFNINLPR